MKKFEVGKTYKSEEGYTYEILKRTKSYVTVNDVYGQTRYKVFTDYKNIEYFHTPISSVEAI